MSIKEEMLKVMNEAGGPVNAGKIDIMKEFTKKEIFQALKESELNKAIKNELNKAFELTDLKVYQLESNKAVHSPICINGEPVT